MDEGGGRLINQRTLVLPYGVCPTVAFLHLFRVPKSRLLAGIAEDTSVLHPPLPVQPAELLRSARRTRVHGDIDQ
jgi:hypothetical protein